MSQNHEAEAPERADGEDIATPLVVLPLADGDTQPLEIEWGLCPIQHPAAMQQDTFAQVDSQGFPSWAQFNQHDHFPPPQLVASMILNMIGRNGADSSSAHASTHASTHTSQLDSVSWRRAPLDSSSTHASTHASTHTSQLDSVSWRRAPLDLDRPMHRALHPPMFDPCIRPCIDPCSTHASTHDLDPSEHAEAEEDASGAEVEEDEEEADDVEADRESGDSTTVLESDPEPSERESAAVEVDEDVSAPPEKRPRAGL